METSSVQTVVNIVVPVFEAVDAYLHNTAEDHISKLEDIITSIVETMQLDKRRAADATEMIKVFVRNHPDFVTKRGPHGGVMWRSHHSKIESDKNSKAEKKNKAKQEVQDKLESKIK
jgi:hypothetical protein